MATIQTGFVRDDSTTWTAGGMRRYLGTGTMHDTFFKEIFGWNDAELQEAIQRATDALQRAGIKPTETLCPIRFEKGTQLWTQGALKRLTAEADLVARSADKDCLFSLPHEKNDWLPPLRFRKDMMLAGREPHTVYRFPTFVQKLFQYARDYTKERMEQDATWQTSSGEARLSDSLQAPKHSNKRDASPLSRHGKMARRELGGEDPSTSNANEARHATPERARPQLDNADVHVGWIRQQKDDSFILEKDYRSLRTWLVGPEPLNYDYKTIRRSLGMAQDPELGLFWFEDPTLEPWIVKSNHAIAGAIERIHSKGKICFLLATDIEHVRALTPDQRGECFMVSACGYSNTDGSPDIQKQKVQTLTLNMSVAGVFDQHDQMYCDVFRLHTDHLEKRSALKPYVIPGLSVSLARILGEQVMRSRIHYSE